jgi:hypothetical protein
VKWYGKHRRIFPYLFTIFFCIFHIFSLFNLDFFHIFHICSLLNLSFFHIVFLIYFPYHFTIFFCIFQILSIIQLGFLPYFSYLSEKIWKIQKKIEKRFEKYRRKISWIVKRQGKYGRNVSTYLFFIISISFHYFLLYFPYLFTIQFGFLPYFSYQNKSLFTSLQNKLNVHLVLILQQINIYKIGKHHIKYMLSVIAGTTLLKTTNYLRLFTGQ